MCVCYKSDDSVFCSEDHRIISCPSLFCDEADKMFSVQDGRDCTVAAAKSGHPGADCCEHGGHHEGLQGKLASQSITECHEGIKKKKTREFVSCLT